MLKSSDVSIDSLTKSDTGIVGLSQGISILTNGGIILAKGYDFAKNDDVYFRINSVTNLTEIAYSIDPDNSRFTFWQAYNIPINVFNQVNCYRYTPDLGEIKYYIGNTVTYISPETNEEDSAVVTATYTDKDNNIYYQLSRESKLFADDSKDVHNSGNETMGDDKMFDGIAYQYSVQGDDLDTSYMNDGVILTGVNEVVHAPAGTDGTWAIIRNYNANDTNGAQSYYDTKQGVLYFRTRNNSTEYSPWVQVADDSKVVHSIDMRKPASDVAGIEEVNAKQDKIGYTPADDSKVVHSADMRKPASDVAGIEEVNAKQDKIGYTPADDSKVAHLSGANNFDTVPTVKNNPLLLASSLPSDLARTGSDQEFTGKNIFDTAPIDKKTGNPYITKSDVPKVDLSSYATNSQLATKADDSNVVHKTGDEEILGGKTFDTAPIDKATGNPYITKDGVPAVPSTLADTTKDANFTEKLQKSGIDVATKSDVTTAVSAATTNMADDSKVVHNTGTEEIAGQKTFDTAPIDKATGNPYITRSDVPEGNIQIVTQAQYDSLADNSGLYVIKG